ncbi:acetyl/propionyl/methylcrotonyl-CoA carboxylase subunit alpha [Streptomyces odontomachi]|uniref:acetyl/propionyl/methylcrotonyl-CoA carboxylase subunit alpha n=1 Tax=Streptomyces odontomachi TaxID=2944940 RepID=UPI002109B743|nr:biotin carboxylase N-terminal domain-containing protein [Streptomyces sp. ODS25]
MRTDEGDRGIVDGGAPVTISSVLVANRGEIACRVVRTCRDLGIATVAVHSDADADALHARVADVAVRLPGDAPADTYLRGELLVKAALAAGADAVHPGYGFLSESADFARAVLDAGLVWIGPPPHAIEAMASKTRAKELMGVPSVTDPERLTEADFPVLVKAAAGGGGRGMRMVREPAALAAELAAARAEAHAAFGDGTVFVEPYVADGRHVEVQLLADAHGTVWTLGTRDCSLQRRHQKVIEEAPAPGLAPDLVARLYADAERAARAIGYRGAGTVEFLVTAGADGAGEDDANEDDAGEEVVHFLEMNTRLQVEHPVTEAVFGLDLVAWQIRIAEGHPLDRTPPPARGHAVEARLYAEDPARDWAPQAGVLHRLAVPGARPGTALPGRMSEPSAQGPAAGPEVGLRLDTGYADGDRIGVHYDALLAKAVAWAPTRAEAIRRLAAALEHARVQGPVTNRELLLRSLRHPEFAAARMDTGFYDRHLAALTAHALDPYPPLAAALTAAQGRSRFGGFRNVPSQAQTRRYRAEPDGPTYTVRYRHTRDGVAADGVVAEAAEDAEGASDQPSEGARDASAWPETGDVRVVRVAAEQVVLDVDGVRRTFDVAVHGDRVYVGNTAFTALPRLPDPAAPEQAPGSLLAPMPGTVVRLAANIVPGAPVRAGQPLLWLEAMKMEHEIRAPVSGTVTALHAAPGHQVEKGALLAVVGEAAVASAAAVVSEESAPPETRGGSV